MDSGPTPKHLGVTRTSSWTKVAASQPSRSRDTDPLWLCSHVAPWRTAPDCEPINRFQIRKKLRKEEDETNSKSPLPTLRRHRKRRSTRKRFRGSANSFVGLRANRDTYGLPVFGIGTLSTSPSSTITKNCALCTRKPLTAPQSSEQWFRRLRRHFRPTERPHEQQKDVHLAHDTPAGLPDADYVQGERIRAWRHS